MGAPEDEFLTLRLQRQAYAKVLMGARKLSYGILNILGVFVIVYFVPTILAYAVGGLQNAEQQIAPALVLFAPIGMIGVFTVGLLMVLIFAIFFIAMTSLAFSAFKSISKGTDLIHDGMRMLGRIGAPGPGPFHEGDSLLMLGVTIIGVGAVPLLIAITPGSPLGSLGLFIVQLAIDVAFALIAIGLITLGIAFWKCGSTCGQSDVKEGGAAIVVGMTLFLLSWGTILVFQFSPAMVHLRLNMATLLSLMPALPAYCVLGFIAAYAGVVRTYVGIRRLL